MDASTGDVCGLQDKLDRKKKVTLFKTEHSRRVKTMRFHLKQLLFAVGLKTSFFSNDFQGRIKMNVLKL